MQTQKDDSAGNGPDKKKLQSVSSQSNKNGRFLLESAFPDVQMLLSPSSKLSAAGVDVIIVLDTNVLLLPYNIGTDDFSAIAQVYRSLAKERRLYVPARVIREFIKNRDSKLADLLQALNVNHSKIFMPDGKLSPLLVGMAGYQELQSAVEAIKVERKKYNQAFSTLVEGVRAWRGNDPVTEIYCEVFAEKVIVDHDDSEFDLSDEWDGRRLNKIPPGYKDGNKDDTGIGDFLIWKTLLRLGRENKKDIIFVTGEEKADWFVRSNNSRVFPRPELIDEYRRASGGKSIKLSTLNEVLEEMKVSPELVQEIKGVEEEANHKVHMEQGVNGGGAGVQYISFDYSTNDGVVLANGEGASVAVSFSKASDRSIYIYRSGGAVRVARAKNIAPGEVFSLNDLDSSSRVYRIGIGEAFVVCNGAGQVLVGRILELADDTRGGESDNVTFSFVFFNEGQQLVAP